MFNIHTPNSTAFTRAVVKILQKNGVHIHAQLTPNSRLFSAFTRAVVKTLLKLVFMFTPDLSQHQNASRLFPVFTRAVVKILLKLVFIHA